MDRVELLDEVGDFLLIPNIELASTKQVAEFYGIGMDTFKSTIKRNKEELGSNGMKMTSHKEFSNESKSEFKKQAHITVRKEQSTYAFYIDTIETRYL